MSGKSIKPLQATAYYFSVDPTRDAGDKIRVFFSRLFTAFHPVDPFQTLIDTFSGEHTDTARVVVWDLRGSSEYFSAFLPLYIDQRAALKVAVQLIVCEENQPEKIIRLAREGRVPEHILMVPWKAGIPERVIGEVRMHLEYVETQKRASEAVQLNTGGNREYIEKLNAANAYYADHSRAMQTEVKHLVSLVKTMSRDEEVRHISYLGRLIQYADVLQQETEALVQFSSQNWHSYQHQMIFDINTVLDTISSTSIPFLQSQGIELIFEVGNSVPARLKGYPLGTTDALITILDLIAHAKVNGELILRLSLEKERDDHALLNVQFMQSHYRGSVANVVLSTIRKDQQFDTLLERMNEIEGVVLHSDSDTRGDILQLSFKVQTLERRSYRLPSKAIMDKTVLIIDDRKKNAEVLQKMLMYFHMASSISVQLDEAILHIQDHEYDIIIVTERLVKRCAKRCKQAQRYEKFIVIHSGSGVQSDYLGLDIADSFLREPYTHKGIFNTLVDIFSETNVEERMEDIETLKSYLTLLVKDRNILYVGKSGMAVRSMEMFLEGTQMRLETTRDITGVREQYDFVLLEIDPHMLRNDFTALEHYLSQGKELSKKGRVVCVVPEEIDEEELEVIAPMSFVLTYFQEPIDPEVFYKVLLDWVMGS